MTTLLTVIALVATAGVFLLTRIMHSLSLRAQFGILLGLGVAIGFLFLMMVQMAWFPMWLGISEDRVRREANSNLFDGGYSDLNPSPRSGNQR